MIADDAMQMNDKTDEGFYWHRARYYDPIYHWKDYAAESARLHALITEAEIAEGSRILDAGCGTGSHMVHLRDLYDVSGFDSSPHMLEMARAKLPGLPLWQADMADFAVERPFDGLLCLFSAIGYVFPENQLRSAAACFANAVRPGGMLIVEPWIDPNVFMPNHRMMHTYNGDDLKLCRMAASDRETRGGIDLAIIDFFWLALEAAAEKAEHFTERHEVWLCPRDLMHAIFEDAGFAMRFEPDGLLPGRGLFVGTRRSI